MAYTAAFPARPQVRCQPLQADVSLPAVFPRFTRPSTNLPFRFVEFETWRKTTNLDDTIAGWDYPEKADIFKYYPQYYHKTDKVRIEKHLWSIGKVR